MKRKLALVYGRHALVALLKFKPELVKNLYYSPGKNSEDLKILLDLAKKHKIKPKRVDKTVIDKLTEAKNHQGMAAECASVPVYNERDLPALLSKKQKPLVLILDSIQDPHNLGACLRTADASDVACVIYTRRQSVGLTDVVHKVASGATFSVPIVEVANLSRAIQIVQEEGVWVIGTSSEAEQSVYQADLSGKIALVMGNEGSGMRKLTTKQCDEFVKIPMLGVVESLNISVATSICLYEAVRQREYCKQQ